MAKRFIDTGLFDDDWFMVLSSEAKLLWIYFITKCDHAGIIKINEKLCRVQTDINDLDTIIKELGNRLVTVSEHLYFIPKFIEFQYPGFPKSKVRQQASVLVILEKYNLLDKLKLTVNKDLPKTYGNGNGNGEIKEDSIIENFQNINPFSKFSFTETKKILTDHSQIWHEQIMMSDPRIKTSQQLIGLITKFLLKQNSTGSYFPTSIDNVRRHFANTLPKMEIENTSGEGEIKRLSTVF